LHSGPNGSGKTTLLQLILGYLQPDRGRVVIDGKNIHSLSPAERSRLMGYVPQINEYPYNYRVREAVLLGRAAGKPGWFTPGIGDERAVDATLERLDLLSLSERPVHSLSGGELQLVNIARSLITNPRILILDEPESHLDPARDLRLHRMLIETGIRRHRHRSDQPQPAAGIPLRPCGQRAHRRKHRRIGTSGTGTAARGAEAYIRNRIPPDQRRHVELSGTGLSARGLALRPGPGFYGLLSMCSKRSTSNRP
jgi:ABC-type transport system involved in cytochrome c biogenesis ATPase subunit